MSVAANEAGRQAGRQAGTPRTRTEVLVELARAAILALERRRHVLGARPRSHSVLNLLLLAARHAALLIAAAAAPVAAPPVPAAALPAALAAALAAARSPARAAPALLARRQGLPQRLADHLSDAADNCAKQWCLPGRGLV